ncbi:phage integrase SAM-like domain-containing protein [Gillisia sp. JM1]|uniref:phage integrase SAM-like domain-containing protein n=1 Tax=Gillisia sp. JM1 TaxID=1283286 RepID=UPI000423E983|nr:phage integrase SAM-like domain-containing protein [Gillisia sp. JM1]
MPNYTTFSVLFFVRKHHNETKKLFIYARVTVDGKRSEISLKRSISVNHWDVSKGRARGTAPKARSLNQYLDQVYTKFLDCHKLLSSENKVISAQSIKARFYGNDEHQKTLLELMSYHNSHMKNVLKPGTMKNYRTTETYLKEFLKNKMNCNDINIKQIKDQTILLGSSKIMHII